MFRVFHQIAVEDGKGLTGPSLQCLQDKLQYFEQDVLSSKGLFCPERWRLSVENLQTLLVNFWFVVSGAV